MSETLDIKLLKKLADACRKAGISSFKGHGIEFTLGDAPEPARRTQGKALKANYEDGKDPVTEDEPTAEDLLYWSAGGTTMPGLGLITEESN